jgi:hypothetical protein
MQADEVRVGMRVKLGARQGKVRKKGEILGRVLVRWNLPLDNSLSFYSWEDIYDLVDDEPTLVMERKLNV